MARCESDSPSGCPALLRPTISPLAPHICSPFLCESLLVEARDQILTVSDVASEMQCSKAHVYHAINGKVPGVSSLPAISMGRRKFIRRSSFEQWKQANERTAVPVMIDPSLKNHSVGA